jgi:hypothetical protein
MTASLSTADVTLLLQEGSVRYWFFDSPVLF